MRLPRASGILMHPTSLPGRFGIGDLGPSAGTFVEFLADAGQRWWQMLPVGPTGYGHSPYQSSSSHAGNPLLISPERLVEEGYLSANDLDDYPETSVDQVDFETVALAKHKLLERAFENFGNGDDDPDYAPFTSRNAHWLDDYALFVALKDAHEGRSWNEWEPELVAREPAALADWARGSTAGSGTCNSSSTSSIVSGSGCVPSVATMTSI